MRSITSCDCNALSAAGVSGGGCCSAKCESCQSDGACASTCPSPRECCDGTCLPITKKCQDGNGVDKCTSGKTYCSTGNTSTSYDCCDTGQKCCGPDGCKPSVTTTTLRVYATTNDWTPTGISVTSAIRIDASGFVKYGTGSTQTASPEGMDNEPCEVMGFCGGVYQMCPAYPSVTPVLTACHASLVGKVGSSTFFKAGTYYSGNPGTGLLYLRVNDSNTGDNSGYFDVSIISSQDPCPDYTPASTGEPIVYPPQVDPDTTVASGPGTETKAVLSLFGIVASPTCSCSARARQMDAWGEYGCLKRIPEITGWLREEAQKRGLWFFAPAGVALILLAISTAALKRLWKANNR